MGTDANRNEAPSMGSAPVDVSAVYTRLLDLCPPFALPPSWAFLTPDSDCRQTPASGPKVLAALEREFGPELLRQAGVTVELPSGAAVLSPMLAAAGRGLLALRDREHSPFGIVTPDGSLSRQVPLFAFCKDRRTRQAARRFEQRIFAVPALADVVLFRSLGLAAAPMTALDRLRLDALRFLKILTG